MSRKPRLVRVNKRLLARLFSSTLWKQGFQLACLALHCGNGDFSSPVLLYIVETGILARLFSSTLWKRGF